jgi:hypothetical protein
LRGKGKKRELSRHALDGKAPEFRVIVANLAGIHECRGLAIRIVLLNAFPLLNGRTLRRCPFDRSYILANGQNAPTGCFDRGLGERRVFV